MCEIGVEVPFSIRLQGQFCTEALAPISVIVDEIGYFRFHLLAVGICTQLHKRGGRRITPVVYPSVVANKVDPAHKEVKLLGGMHRKVFKNRRYLEIFLVFKLDGFANGIIRTSEKTLRDRKSVV